MESELDPAGVKTGGMYSYSSASRYIGIYVNVYSTGKENPLKTNIPVRMPCGYVVAPPEAGWPMEATTIMCPCRDSRHILFQRT